MPFIIFTNNNSFLLPVSIVLIEKLFVVFIRSIDIRTFEDRRFMASFY